MSPSSFEIPLIGTEVSDMVVSAATMKRCVSKVSECLLGCRGFASFSVRYRFVVIFTVSIMESDLLGLLNNVL